MTDNPSHDEWEPPIDNLQVVVAVPRVPEGAEVWAPDTPDPWSNNTAASLEADIAVSELSFADPHAAIPDDTHVAPEPILIYEPFPQNTDGSFSPPPYVPPPNGTSTNGTIPNGTTPSGTSANGTTTNGTAANGSSAHAEPASTAVLSSDVLNAEGRLFKAAPPRQIGGVRPRRHGLLTALRTLLRQRRRMLLSVVAVALGVGYLAGSLSLLQRVGAGLAAQSGKTTELADLVIEGSIADDGPFQQNRRLVSDSLVQALRSVPGVAAVEPRLESPSMLIIGESGKPIVGFGLTERPLGANFPKSPLLNPYKFFGKGKPPETPNDVVIDRRSAAAAGVEVGSQVLIASKKSPETYTVTGIVDLSNAQLPSGSSLALFETEAARPLFDTGGDDTAIAIKVAKGAPINEVRDQIASMLYPGAEVATAAEYSEHRQAALGKSFTMIRFLLVGFAVLALVVGSFTVANSMALLFDTRRRGFAMLRLLGGSTSQLIGAASMEATINGLAAGAVGLLLGLGIGRAIEAIIGTMGTPLPVVGSPLTWWIPVIAIGVGGLVTLATSLSPAKAAANTPPLHAVTGIETRVDTDGRRRRLAWFLISFGFAITVVTAIAVATGQTTIALIAAAVITVLAVVLVALPKLLSRVVSAMTGVLLGKSVALRRMSALRSRQSRTRSAATTAALLLAAAVVTGLSVLSSSFLASIDGEITKSITADLVIDSGSFTTGGLSADLITQLRRTKGVAAVSSYRPGIAAINGRNWRSGGLSGESSFKLLNLDVIGPTPTSFGPTDVLLSEALAKSEHVSTGDSIAVSFPAGATLQMNVKAVFRSRLSVLLGDIIVDTSVMAQQLPTSKDFLALVNLSSSSKDVKANVTRMAQESGAAHVLKPAKLISTRADLLRGFGRVIQWMLAFSVVLALIGVANTLQLGVNERRRELGLLRAVGATREQVLRLVMAEAAGLSLVGTFFGMLVGFAAAYATVKALSGFGLDQFSVPVWSVVVIGFVAVGFGVLGAIVPAWKATKIPMLEAIADGDRAESSSFSGRLFRRGKEGADTTPTAAQRSNSRNTPPSNPTQSAEEPFSSEFPPPSLTPRSPVTEATRIDSPPPVSSALADDGPYPTNEIPMAMRCYNCGNEPGDGDVCIVCGADQMPSPAAMFGVATEPAPSATASVAAPQAAATAAPQYAAQQFTPPAEDGTVYATGGYDADGVHDAILVDDELTETERNNEYDEQPGRHTLGSIFDERSNGTERSPFGQHAVIREHEELNDPPGRFVADEPAAWGQHYSSPSPQPSPQPSVSHNGGPHFEPDSHGLSVAISRLDSSSQARGLVAFSVAGVLLAADERCISAVAGSSLGMPTVALVTDRRVLIVSERHYVPAVETFHLGESLTVYGRHANGQASLTFGEGGRLVTIDQIIDVGMAVETANAARNRTVGVEF